MTAKGQEESLAVVEFYSEMTFRKANADEKEVNIYKKDLLSHTSPVFLYLYMCLVCYLYFSFILESLMSLEVI